MKGFAALVVPALTALSALAAREASAAPRWVDRPITLPRHDLAVNAGLGVAHDGRGPSDETGAGLNTEVAFGLTSRLELGLRTGLRLGDGGRATSADSFGRTLVTETYGTFAGTVANPEGRVRGALVSTELFELALDGRFMAPIEPGSRAGTMIAAPMALHLGPVRVDSGVFLPLVWTDPLSSAVSVPAHVWIQATSTLWVGPMMGLRFFDVGTTRERTDLLLGAGLGSALTSWLDLKTMFFWPRINATEGARAVGVGVGVELRLE